MRKFLLSLFTFICIQTSFSQVVANFVGTPTLICVGQTVQFTDLSTGGPTTRNWTFPGGSPATSTLQNVVVTYTNVGTYNVSLFASNGGFPSFITKNNYITVIAEPATPTPITGSSSSCSGQSGNYTVTPVSGASSYSWTVPVGSSILSGQGTNSITVNFGSTFGNVCVTASNACGTSAASCMSVTINPPPTVLVNPTNTTICSGSSTTLTASGASTYSWSPSSGLSSTTGATVTASPTLTTTYSVVGTTTAGCTNSATTNITVNPNPTITINPNEPTICIGGSVTLTASGASTYSWSPGTGLSSTTGASVIASPTITTTYTSVGTSTSGCEGSAVVTVTVTSTPPSAPGPGIGSSTPCSGQATSYFILPVTNVSTYSWTVPAGATILSGQGTNTLSVNLGLGSGNICVTASNACGISAASCLSVSPVPPPVISVNPTNTTICSGSSATLTASGASTYSWSPSSGLSSTTGATVTASPTLTTTYSVVGTTTAGCTNSATTGITVNPNPTITINPNAPTICIGGSVTLTASGASTYSWSPGTGLSSTTGASVIANPAITTTYTSVGTSTSGCEGSAVVTVMATIIPPLTPDPITGSSSSCSGQSGNYTVTPVSGASSYSWTVPVGSSILSGQGTNSITVNFGSTSGNVCVTASNACGTSAASCMSVTINPPPTVLVNPTNTTICSGSSTTLTASGASTYSWSPSSGLSSTTGATVTASPLLTTTYSVMGTTTEGCTNSATTNITVTPNPTITITPNAPSICANGSVTLTASGASTYSWSPSSGLSSTTGATVTASPTLTTAYSVVGTTTNACTNSATVTVNIVPSPTITVLPNAPSICIGGSVTLNASGASTYTWSPSIGLSSTFGSTVIASPNITTNYTVVGTTTAGCKGSDVVTVKVSNTPPPAPFFIIGSQSGCSGQPGIYFALPVGTASSYSWTVPFGTFIVSGQGTNSITVLPFLSSTGNVCVTASNGCGTSPATCLSVTISPPPTIAISPALATICAGSSTTLTASGANIYNWSPVTGLNNPFSATVIASPSVTTTYSVTGITTAGCIDIQTVTVTVSNSGPGAPGAIFGSSNVCISQAAQNYSIAAVSGVTSYSWSAPLSYSIITGQGTSQVSVATSSVSGNICVVAINQCGTSPSSCFSVSVNGPPLLTASIIPGTCTGTINDNNGSILISNFSSADKVDFVIGLTYSGTATYSSASFIPVSGVITNTLANPTNTVAYTVRLFNSFGCYKDTTLILTSSNCFNELFIPNVFTPDGDGNNDFFVISGLPSGIDNTLTVYNRWGSKVYSKSNYDNKWNGFPNVSGTLGTEKLPKGTYYYILEFNGGDIKNKNGFIAIEY